MIKRSLTIVAVMMLLVGTSFAQQWTFKGYFPDPSLLKTNTGIQFVVVDKDNNVWVNPYSTDGDSLFVPDSAKMKKVRPVFVYKADGTLLDVIKGVTVNGVLYPFYSTGYGLSKDADGNILVVKASTMYRINQQTHEGMGLVNPFGVSMISPACDAAGNIYVGAVEGGHPIKVLSSDFTDSGVNVTDTLSGYGRWLTVSPDGNTVYAPRYSANTCFKISRNSEFDPYVKDTVLGGAAIESGVWDPVYPGKIWFSMGNVAASPCTGVWTGYEGTMLMFDPATWTHSDSVKYQLRNPTADERVRGMAFSNDGTNLYVVEFGTSDSSMQVFNNPGHKVQDVKKVENTVVTNYSLDQNYPNPFNPTTTINFSVVKSGNVSLKVFNMLGQEVATLVNGNLSVGSYKANFDASKLSSGIYIYQLNAGNVSISKKMTLLK